jgi:peptidoglycan/LPS O-acetylase OafA/YrhL
VDKTGNQTAPGNRFATLDGLRGIAAMVVLMLHEERLISRHLFDSRAFLAVDFFFCLSGFVIYHAYSSKLRAGLSFNKFMAIRLQRLGPLFILGQFLGLLAFGLMTAMAKPELRSQAMDALIGVVGLVGLPAPPHGLSHKLYPLNPVAWSLFFEVLINAAFVVYIRRERRLTGAAILLFSLLAVIIAAYSMNGLQAGIEWSDFPIGLARVFWSFSAGIMLYKFRDHPAISWLRAPPMVLFVLIAIALLLPMRGVYQGAYDLACATILFPAIIVAGARGESRGWFATFEGQLGRASYAVYITHYPLHLLYSAVVARLIHAPAESAAPWSGLAFVPIAFAAAIAFDTWLDAPIREWLGRRRRARSALALAVE